jgi:Translationally controlled tumour protein
LENLCCPVGVLIPVLNLLNVKFVIRIFVLQHITRAIGDVQLEGANASAEEADEGTDSASESGVDLVLNHRLVETG